MFVRPNSSSREKSSKKSAARKGGSRVRDPGAYWSEEEDPKSAPLRPTRLVLSDPEQVPPRGESKSSVEREGGGESSATRERVATILVEPGNLQTTFENMISVISSGEEAEFSRATVLKMIETMYEWMVFNPSSQIAIPSAPGSTTARMMWPQGSTVDTRRKKERSAVQSSPRRLRDIDEDCTSTIASSVVSSALEEETTKVKKGSVVYSSDPYVAPLNYVPFRGYTQGSQFQPLPQSPPQHVEQGQASYDPRCGVPRGLHYGSLGATPEERHLPVRPARAAPRYSMVEGAAQPPERVEETPQLPYNEAVQKKAIRKAKVGAAARPMNNVEEGSPVVWES